MSLVFHFISTHTPLAGRDRIDLDCIAPWNISTHTPLAGRDQALPHRRREPNHFYSHAPRGARPPQRYRLSGAAHFYSHAPRGARPYAGINCYDGNRFLLTRPSRGATGRTRVDHSGQRISTHTPLAGRDHMEWTWCITESISTHTPLAGRDNSDVLRP